MNSFRQLLLCPGSVAEYCHTMLRACLWVCMWACLRYYTSTHHQIFLHVALSFSGGVALSQKYW